MAAPVYASHTTAVSDGGTTSLSINRPSGTTDGDRLLLFVCAFSDRTITAPSGFAEAEGVTSGTVFLQLRCYTKVASSEPTSYSIGLDSSSDLVAVLLRVTGTSVATDVSASQANTTNSTSCVAPSVTTTVADTLLLTAHGTTSGLSATFSPPSGMTERADVVSLNSPFGSPISIEVNTQTLTSAGATGTRTATMSDSVKSLGLTMALKESGGAGGGAASPWLYVAFANNG